MGRFCRDVTGLLAQLRLSHRAALAAPLSLVGVRLNSRIERTLNGSMKAVRRKPPGVLCTRFQSIKNVEPMGNDEVVGIELLTEWGDFAAMLPGCLRSSA